MEVGRNEGGPQRRLLRGSAGPSQKGTDDRGTRHPSAPPLRQYWGHRGQPSWLDCGHDEIFVPAITAAREEGKTYETIVE
jgi:hypothetical protein